MSREPGMIAINAPDNNFFGSLPLPQNPLARTLRRALLTATLCKVNTYDTSSLVFRTACAHLMGSLDRPPVKNRAVLG